MNIKRNDKCNCGSGKKYKHCCENKSNKGSNNYIKIATLIGVSLLVIFSFYAIYESQDYPEQEYYKCENPNCTQLHKRTVTNTDSETNN